MQIASTQFNLNASDLEFILTLVRSGTLARAGERMGVDTSTVFRAVARIEKGLGQRLFDRSRAGYRPLELADEIARQAERIEAALEAARSATQAHSGSASGLVRVTTTDTLLHDLVVPALKLLHRTHPLITFDLQAGNELASLTRRDADIAVRATKRPPPHLVGKHVGTIQIALFVATTNRSRTYDVSDIARSVWIAPDDALPEHPSVLWRKKHFPKVVPAYKVNSILTAAELVAQGLGIALLPTFLTRRRKDLKQLTEPLEECQTELWLLTHVESRYLRRVSTVFNHLSQNVALN
jgi:DNA-binding transcriptional LysR family regulator